MSIELETERIARQLALNSGLGDLWELFLAEAYSIYHSGLWNGDSLDVVLD